MNEDDNIKLDPSMAAATNFSNDFLSSSPVRGEIGKSTNFDLEEPRETESSSQSPDSCSPCPNDEEQRFNNVWNNGQIISNKNGRKEGDSGFISPAGASNTGHIGMEGINPFNEANFHAGLHKTSSNDYDSSKTPSLGTEPEDKVLDSSLESENDNHFEFVKKNSVDNQYDDKTNGYSHHFNDFDQNDHFPTNGNLNLMQSENKTFYDNDLVNSSKFEDIETYSASADDTGKLAINNENYLDDYVKEEPNNLVEDMQPKISNASTDSSFVQDEEMFRDEKFSGLENESMTNEGQDQLTAVNQKNDDISDILTNTTHLDESQEALEPVKYDDTDTLITTSEPREVHTDTIKDQVTEEYNYKLSEDDGCMDPMTTSMIVDNKLTDDHYINDAAASSSDDEGIEKKDEEKSYTSTESEDTAEQPYEKLQEEFDNKEAKIGNDYQANYSSVDLVDNVPNNFDGESASSNVVHFDKGEHNIEFEMQKPDTTEILDEQSDVIQEEKIDDEKPYFDKREEPNSQLESVNSSYKEEDKQSVNQEADFSVDPSNIEVAEQFDNKNEQLVKDELQEFAQQAEPVEGLNEKEETFNQEDGYSCEDKQFNEGIDFLNNQEENDYTKEVSTSDNVTDQENSNDAMETNNIVDDIMEQESYNQETVKPCAVFSENESNVEDESIKEEVNSDEKLNDQSNVQDTSEYQPTSSNIENVEVTNNEFDNADPSFAESSVPQFENNEFDRKVSEVAEPLQNNEEESTVSSNISEDQAFEKNDANADSGPQEFNESFEEREDVIDTQICEEAQIEEVVPTKSDLEQNLVCQTNEVIDDSEIEVEQLEINVPEKSVDEEPSFDPTPTETSELNDHLTEEEVHEVTVEAGLTAAQMNTMEIPVETTQYAEEDQAVDSYNESIEAIQPSELSEIAKTSNLEYEEVLAEASISASQVDFDESKVTVPVDTSYENTVGMEAPFEVESSVDAVVDESSVAPEELQFDKQDEISEQLVIEDKEEHENEAPVVSGVEANVQEPIADDKEEVNEVPVISQIESDVADQIEENIEAPLVQTKMDAAYVDDPSEDPVNTQNETLVHPLEVAAENQMETTVCEPVETSESVLAEAQLEQPMVVPSTAAGVEAEEKVSPPAAEIIVEEAKLFELENTVTEPENTTTTDATSIETTNDYQPPLNDNVINDTIADDSKATVVDQAPAEETKVDEKISTEDVAKIAKTAVKAASSAVKKAPKPPTTLPLTKTTPKPSARNTTVPTTRAAASKPRVPPTSTTKAPAPTRTTPATTGTRTTARPASAATSRTPAPKPSSRPASARVPPSTATTRASAPKTTPAAPRTTTTSRVTRSLHPETKTTPKVDSKPTTNGSAPRPTALRMKLTPRPTSTSRLREASAARVKAEIKASTPTSKPQTPTARTPLSSRSTPTTKTPPKRTPTKPSAASASSKELANTPFAKRQARLRAKSAEKNKPAKKDEPSSANGINGHAETNGHTE